MRQNINRQEPGAEPDSEARLDLKQGRRGLGQGPAAAAGAAL